MCDIWWQWHSSKFIQYLFKNTLKLKIYYSISFLNYISYSSTKHSITKINPCSDFALLSRLYKAFPCGLCLPFQQKYLYSSSGILLYTHKPCRYYFSLIKYQTITLIHIFNNIIEMLMAYISCFLIKYQKS